MIRYTYVVIGVVLAIVGTYVGFQGHELFSRDDLTNLTVGTYFAIGIVFVLQALVLAFYRRKHRFAWLAAGIGALMMGNWLSSHLPGLDALDFRDQAGLSWVGVYVVGAALAMLLSKKSTPVTITR